MSKRLSGLNPLAYMGVEPNTPPQLVTINRQPNSNDWQGFNLGTFWLNEDTQDLWVLVSVEGNVAVWVLLYPNGGSGTVTQFTTDSGMAVPDGAGNVNVLGGTNINTNAFVSTIEVNLNDSITLVGDLTVSSLGAGVVQTDAGGLFFSDNGTDGQVLIGGGTEPQWQTLTEGSGISITNGANSITIAATGGGMGATTFHTDGADAMTAGGAITIAGGNNIITSGAGSTVTIDLNDTTDHAVQVGNATGSLTSIGVGATNTVLLGNTGADPSFGTVPNAALTNSSITLNNGNNITVTGSPVSLGGAATIAVSGTTNHAVQVGNASASLTSLTVGTNGQVLIGATGANPAFATLTSSGGTITFTPGANTLNLEAVGGGSGLTTVHTDSGDATVAAGAITITGGNNIGTTGSGSTVTVNVDGTTNHAVQVGNAGGSLTSVSPSVTLGVPLISQGASADPVFGTAVVAGGGTGNTTFTAFSVICAGTTSTGAFQNVSGLGTAGQVLTSNGAGTLPTWQAGGGGGGLLTATVTLTSAQVKALNGTPVTLIAAQGAGTMISIVSWICKLNFGSNAFTSAGGGQIGLYYTNNASSTGLIANILGNTSLTSTSNQTWIGPIVQYTTATPAPSTTKENTPVVVDANATIAGNAANDNTVYVNVLYQIITP